MTGYPKRLHISKSYIANQQKLGYNASVGLFSTFLPPVLFHFNLSIQLFIIFLNLERLNLKIDANILKNTCYIIIFHPFC